jgi:ribose transport system substrate-binding protein
VVELRLGPGVEVVGLKRRSVMKKAAAGFLLLATVGLLAACGGGGSSSGSGTTEGGSTGESASTSGATTTLVKEAEEVTAEALEGVVEGPDGALHPSEVEAYGKWRGPTTGPPPKKGESVQIILCSGEAAACVETGEAAEEAMKELGWNVETIDGRGTPENFVKAFDLAISRKPDAILSVAVPTETVSAQLKECEEKGIPTMVVADAESPPAGGVPHYGAYIGTRQTLSMPVLAWALIARSQGKANVIQVRDPGFPILIEAQDTFDKVLETCPECSIHKVEWQITEASNATKVSSIIRAAVSQDPEAEYIQMPYSIGIPFVLATLREMGKSEQISVTSKDLPVESVKEVNEGTVLYDIGNPLEWLGYASANEVVRLLGGEKALGGEHVGLGVSLFDQEKAPSSGIAAEWSGWPDFRAEYRKLWGLS